ncbi:YoaK family protein [Acrocarpospora macrocephala]|uniref:Membrane protein n=1 Tax=Acrocarpospora macrocephala TaxID=150177 RepID=A0A5M3WJE0_9ACTN|nr:YoaK family protein [Acrocarpospora macrocephala]GES07291.1 membrane protein [Acrocarpospora macrocephala]
MDVGGRDLLPPAILTLTVVSGLVDAVSFLGLGQVFTSAMTGNIVMLGLALGGASGFAVGPPLVAVGAYVAGVVGGGLLGRVGRHWLLVALIAEASLLALASGVAFMPVSPYALIVILALAMGMRNVTTRHLGVADLTNTTVMTTTVTSMIIGSPIVGGHDPHIGRLAASVVALVCGVTVGAWLLHTHGIAWTLVLATIPVAMMTTLVGCFTRPK